MQRVTVHVLLLAALITLPSCIKYHDLLRSEFPQGKEHPGAKAITENYVRSCAVYEGFQTRGLFNALWLSECTLRAYVSRVGMRQGLSCKQQDELYQRLATQHLDNKTSFYVLADIRDQNGMEELNEQRSAWAASLEVSSIPTTTADECTRIATKSIKEVDLEPEFQRFFGSAYTHHKTAYLVTFDTATPANQLPKLHLDSPEKGCVLDWNCPNQNEQATREDFYWS